MSSIIRPLVVKRAVASSPHLNPLQWSDNHQLAINNDTQITILEPKLPSFASAVSVAGSVVLESKDVFQTTTVLRPESHESLPLRNFNKVVVEALDEPYSFKPSNESLIVGHQWTPSQHSSRDGYLGVLFNSGELLIFERANNQLGQFKVKIDMFQALCSEFGVEYDDTEILVPRQAFRSLKIKSFSFTQVPTGPNPLLLVTVITHNGNILVYQLTGSRNENLTLRSRIDTEDNIMKQIWSSWSEEGQKYVNRVAVVSRDNGVHYYNVTHDVIEGTISLSEPVSILPSSRFLNQKNEWTQLNGAETFISTSTGKLAVAHISKDDEIQATSVKMSNFNSVSGIIKSVVQEQLHIIVSFENGNFESFNYDLKTRTIKNVSTSKELTSFVGKCLYTYQMSKSEDNDGDEPTQVKQEEVTSSIKESVIQNLSRPSEGSFINYGISLAPDGIITIIYKVIPKDVLIYEITSMSEFQIAFIKSDSFPETITPEMVNNTSIGHLNNFWLKRANILPVFPYDQGRDVPSEQYPAFLESVVQFKENHFAKIETSDLSITDADIYPDFQLTVVNNLNHNSFVKDLQILYNLNKSALSSFSLVPESERKAQTEKSLQEESQRIKSALKAHLYRIILKYVKVNGITPVENIDKYIVIRFYLELRELDENASLEFTDIIPQEAEITITTKFFEESFHVSVLDILDDNSELINSTTDHKWSKCTLTNIPLLQMNNRQDESGEYNYILFDPVLMGQGELVRDLLDTVQFCYITGNKTYNIQ